MRNLTSLVSVIAGSVLLVASAHANDNAQANSSKANIFNADMSNPDLAAVITSFQDVCLPFITHKTELPQSLNQDHRVKLLATQGFEFQSREPKHSRVIVEPAREEWKPASQAINGSSDRPVETRGQFTVFNGFSNQVVKSTVTVVHQTGEIGRVPLTPPRYKQIVRDMDIYVPEKDKRQTALLQWNYASNNHPAKSCQIKLDEASILPESFEAGFIEKDADWLKDSKQEGRWSQCSRDGADEFEFSAERKDGVLSLSVRRNDFYEPDICINWLSARQAFP